MKKNTMKRTMAGILAAIAVAAATVPATAAAAEISNETAVVTEINANDIRAEVSAFFDQVKTEYDGMTASRAAYGSTRIYEVYYQDICNVFYVCRATVSGSGTLTIETRVGAGKWDTVTGTPEDLRAAFDALRAKYEENLVRYEDAKAKQQAEQEAVRQQQVEQEVREMIESSLQDASFDDITAKWRETMKDPSKAFKQGTDKDCGNPQSKQEKESAIRKTMRRYMAGALTGAIKSALRFISASGANPTLGDMLNGPITDFSNMLFGVQAGASNEQVMKHVDEQIDKVIDVINQVTEQIPDKVNDYAVAQEYSKRLTDYNTMAETLKKSIENILTGRQYQNYTADEKTVEIAFQLGNLKNFDSVANPAEINKRRLDAGAVIKPDKVQIDTDENRNLFDLAYSLGLKKSAFRNEVVQNTEYFLLTRINAYLTSSLILTEALTAQEKVAEMTQEEVDALSPDVRDEYNALMKFGGAARAYAIKEELLDELFGENGIMLKAQAYSDMKDISDGITYVGNGKNIKLKREITSYDRSRYEIVLNGGNSVFGNWELFGTDWSQQPLTVDDINFIGQHAYKIGYTLSNYLTKIGFKGVSGSAILATEFYDERPNHSLKDVWNKNWHYLGIKGWDINNRYTDPIGVNLSRSRLIDGWIGTGSYDKRVSDIMCSIMFFRKA